MASETVRVRPATHAKLRQLAKQTGRSMPEVLDDAVETLRRQQLFDAADLAYAKLREDPKAWQAELAERQLWDNALLDGLESD
jgi:hypothetical protein